MKYKTKVLVMLIVLLGGCIAIAIWPIPVVLHIAIAIFLGTYAYVLFH